MGAWEISIKGHGIHHNSRGDDAEQMAAEFAKKLKDAGHQVAEAKLTLTGQETDLLAEQLPIKK